ncbi:MAG: FAD:protein FMN transferase [Gammaproteobacteria bacterium]|nr:FAD:protein FMN transferase [Gammaproteobacteria bacterium]
MNEVKRMQPLLGTFVEISVIKTTQNPDHIQASITQAFHIISTVHTLMSFHDPDSDLSQLNQANGKSIALHPWTLQVLRLAKLISIHSQHLFNCTVGGALIRQGALPEHKKSAITDYGNADDIIINKKTAQLSRSIHITLDGIAKGYAIDRAVSMLKKHGHHTGWINAGGDIRVFGDLSLPIQRRQTNGVLTTVTTVKNAAIATSCWQASYNPRFPALIISTAAQTPSINIATVQAHTAWRADALTKVALLATDAQRAALIMTLKGQLISEH